MATAVAPRRQTAVALATSVAHGGPDERWFGPRKSATQLGINRAAHTVTATTERQGNA